ncbi:MAG: alpha/beta hydrolase family protein [Patescibacteria group bacterium]|jgi:dipeptidyl aminopeptidase/acylaminoacyl peptidase
MKRTKILGVGIIFIFALAIFIALSSKLFPDSSSILTHVTKVASSEEISPMFIEVLRARDYPASEMIIEETLEPGTNYNRYVASYQSDGFKVYGLLTIPTAPKPENGFPTIIFLHGYIAPSRYVTTQDYVASQDGLARNGFITFKPDLRGHAKSEGQATGAHFSETYVVDTINAVEALKMYEQVDLSRIGVWGHSNGGEIGLRAMVVSKDIKAGVFWAGVVGSFEDMLETYNAQIPFMRRSQPELITQYGSPSANPVFWNSIDPYHYLEDVSGPIQLHHGTEDEQVPHELSLSLKTALKRNGKTVEYYEYEGANHNFSGTAFSLAVERSVNFFRKYL